MPVPDPPTDAELISAARAGDDDAFAALVRRHQRAAVRIAAVALGSATDADDVAQEAFVKAHAALPRFRTDARFEPWLYRIVTNTARNHLRSQGRHRARALRASSLATVGSAAPEDEVVGRDERAAVVAALDRLRPDDRLILTFRWYDGLSEAEIAEALGCRRGTVKSRLSRASARLRAELEATR